MTKLCQDLETLNLAEEEMFTLIGTFEVEIA